MLSTTRMQETNSAVAGQGNAPVVTAVKKSNGKTYVIVEEYLGRAWNHPTLKNPNEGRPMVEYRAINPKTGKAWQAGRHALRSKFRDFLDPALGPVPSGDKIGLQTFNETPEESAQANTEYWMMSTNKAAVTGDRNAGRITMDDVRAAIKRVKIARKTRSGVSTRDYILSQVDGKVKTIDMAVAAIARAEERAE